MFLNAFLEASITLVPKPNISWKKENYRPISLMDIYKLNSVMHNINKLHNNSHMISSKDVEKVFDKIQYPLLIIPLQKVRIEGTCPNIIKATYDKGTDNIILNGEKLEASPLTKIKN